MSSPNVLTILKELSAALGQEVVQAACEQFLNKKKEKKERKPRGKSSWNLEVDKVLEEMRTEVAEGETVTYKMAYAEASRRRRETNPEAQLKYEAYRAKVEAKQADKTKGAVEEAAPEPEEVVVSPKKNTKKVEEAVVEIVTETKKGRGRPKKNTSA